MDETRGERMRASDEAETRVARRSSRMDDQDRLPGNCGEFMARSRGLSLIYFGKVIKKIDEQSI